VKQKHGWWQRLPVMSAAAKSAFATVTAILAFCVSITTAYFSLPRDDLRVAINLAPSVNFAYEFKAVAFDLPKGTISFINMGNRAVAIQGLALVVVRSAPNCKNGTVVPVIFAPVVVKPSDIVQSEVLLAGEKGVETFDLPLADFRPDQDAKLDGPQFVRTCARFELVTPESEIKETEVEVFTKTRSWAPSTLTPDVMIERQVVVLEATVPMKATQSLYYRRWTPW
jgi:hypothetical protein